MKYLVFDAHPFGSGGAERNAQFIARNFAEKNNFTVIVLCSADSQFIIPSAIYYVGKVQRILGLLAITRLQLVTGNVAFFAVKGNLPLTIYCRLIRARIVLRYNNSPESYLYWSGLKSIISSYYKRMGGASDIRIFNSSYNKYFYSVIPSPQFGGIYLPNVSWLQAVRASEINDVGRRFIFLGRVAKEKQVCEGIALLHSIGIPLNSIYVFGSGSQTSVIQAQYPQVLIDDYELESITGSDVVISQSLFEGMPNAVIDALAVGAKLLLSINWAHTEFYTECQANGVTDVCLYNPADVRTLQHGIERLGADVESYNQRKELFSRKGEELRSALIKLEVSLEA